MSSSRAISTNGCKSASAKEAKDYAPSGKIEPDDPKMLIPELCNHMYHLGWASGTGGGLSIRQNGFIYCAPSGVQKERIQPQDIFVLEDMTCKILESPSDFNLKVSECLSLFMVPFGLRNAGCCLHSHSINANLITSLFTKRGFNWLSNRSCLRAINGLKNGCKPPEGNGYDEFRISHQEMIKGIKRGSTDEGHSNFDTLVVPIIDNAAHERELADSMELAVRMYPMTNAVLVRNHGLYVWGRDWREAKSQAECYDYLFKYTLEAVKCGFDWMINGLVADDICAQQ